MPRPLVVAVVVATLCAYATTLRAGAAPQQPVTTQTNVANTSQGGQTGGPGAMAILIGAAAGLITSLLGLITIVKVFPGIFNRAIANAISSPAAVAKMEEVLRGPWIEQRILEVLISSAGVTQINRILTMPAAWKDVGPVIENVLPSTWLEREDVKTRLAAVLQNDPCRDAIGEALRGDKAIQNLAAALYSDAAVAALRAFLIREATPIVTSIVDGLDLTDRIVTGILSPAGKNAVMTILREEQARLIALFEEGEVRKRILSWLDTAEGREVFLSLFERTAARAAVTAAVLSALSDDKESLQKLNGMLDSSLLADAGRLRLARDVAGEVAKILGPKE